MIIGTVIVIILLGIPLLLYIFVLLEQAKQIRKAELYWKMCEKDLALKEKEKKK